MVTNLHRPQPPAQRLPDFPWDQLAEAKAISARHPQGQILLSVGSPVDDVPDVIQRGLTVGANSPGYPTVQGLPELRAAIREAVFRRFNIGAGHTPAAGQADAPLADQNAPLADQNAPLADQNAPLADQHVLPVIGTKEFIAGIVRDLGFGPTHVVQIPEVAYPTYEVSALLAQAQYFRSDSSLAVGPGPVDVIFINSPANPSGKVLPVEHLRKMVAYAREKGAILISDECYLGMDWGDTPSVSILNPAVHDGDMRGLLAVHSLSKISNFAGYRFGYVLGDSDIIANLTALRRHSGMMVPLPIQTAALAALQDDKHISRQRELYRSRREVLVDAVQQAGFSVDNSESGLYLWITRHGDCWDDVYWFAQRGVVVTPGTFYSPHAGDHVRVALTATDRDVAAAAQRLK